MAKDTAKPPSIVITANGPYLVSGGVPLDVQTITPNDEGGSWTWTTGRSFDAKPVYALCRCGASATKPYCDGAHAKVGFDGAETASRAPVVEQSKIIPGPRFDLEDAEALCAFARFCDNAGGIWSLVEQTATPGVEQTVVHEETHCPSGRLVLRDKDAHATVEPDLAPSLALVEDPQQACSGPIWVRGGIVVESQDGTAYEVRNRQTLCRCGASSNKPFCDGAHADMPFRDGIA
jgi:CDGSH-type Zn-finger protein